MARKQIQICADHDMMNQSNFSGRETPSENSDPTDGDPNNMIYPPKVFVSGTEVRAKEVILVVLALLILVLSLCLFFKHWKKNYFDINQLPYYAYLYKKDSASATFTVCDPTQVNPGPAGCSCERPASVTIPFWQSAATRGPASKTPSGAMAAATALAAVAVLADSAGNSRTLSRTVSRKAIATPTAVLPIAIPSPGKHPRLCKVATRIDLLRNASAKSSSTSEIANQDQSQKILIAGRPSRYLPPNRAQSDVQARLQMCRSIRNIQGDPLRQIHSSSSSLVLMNTSAKRNKNILVKGFSDNSPCSKELADKLARLDSLPDSGDDEEKDDSLIVDDDDTKAFIQKDNDKLSSSRVEAKMALRSESSARSFDEQATNNQMNKTTHSIRKSFSMMCFSSNIDKNAQSRSPKVTTV